MEKEAEGGYTFGAMAMAFLAGTMIGAAVALLIAPEPGQEIRNRLRRGAKTAQEELADVAAETREALGALTKDARQAIRHTANRLNDVFEATKEALKNETQALRGIKT